MHEKVNIFEIPEIPYFQDLGLGFKNYQVLYAAAYIRMRPK